MSFTKIICIGFMLFGISNGDLDIVKNLLGKDLKSSVYGTIGCVVSEVIYPIFKMSLPDVNYQLFTRSNPDEPCDLQPNIRALRKCNFNPKVETAVLVHGWVGGLPPNDVLFQVKDKLLKQDDYNVVVHNWTFYTNLPTPKGVSYPTNALVTFFMGLRLAAWIKFLQRHASATPQSFHLNGHSLGAHVVSMTGKATCNLGKITFMDAAGPLFRILPKLLNPTYTDALLTQGIHTNGAYTVFGGNGLENAYAHVDHFPNGGSQQSKCYAGASFTNTEDKESKVNSASAKRSCDHDAVYQYYLASFDPDCKFNGLICDSYAEFQSGACKAKNAVPCQMNFALPRSNLDLPVKSQCYFNTLDHHPFCMN